MKNILKNLRPGTMHSEIGSDFPVITNISGGRFPEGIPFHKLSHIHDKIDMYRKLIAVSVIANTIIAIIGFIYL